MAKQKTTFFCQNCGAESPKWIGKCPSCLQWNTFVEEVVQKTPPKDQWTVNAGISENKIQAKRISDIEVSELNRIDTQNEELNRVLGGGLVPGSIVLLGGEPGIGKSTLLLQVALQMINQKVLYISGEESEQQIRMRAERLNLTLSDTFVLTETNMQNIAFAIKQVQPTVVIIDSIQTMHSELVESSAGSISQIRECAGEFHKFAKQSNVPVLLIGHITKDGSLAGPKVLEHMVDSVLQFEGDRNYGYRILRSVKNRFGSTSELGIYEMQSSGLRQVSNPSEILLSHRDQMLSGIAIASTLEGMRPMLIEIQALVSSAAYGTPQRSTTGFDPRRLNMLLAVLEKRVGFRLASKDVFVNIAGGIKVDDPAIDLAVVCAILSSNEDIEIDDKICFAAEVGLSGEIRSVNRIEQRISEAEKLGFERIVISKFNQKAIPKGSKIQVIAVNKVEEVFKYVFT
ncbi:MAG TPA: DNA repair protein RadA [Bacteroidales bacterium]|nr:DNA repair protein RadA [Bacteroidales bacterium]